MRGGNAISLNRLFRLEKGRPINEQQKGTKSGFIIRDQRLVSMVTFSILYAKPNGTQITTKAETRRNGDGGGNGGSSSISGIGFSTRAC